MFVNHVCRHHSAKGGIQGSGIPYKILKSLEY